ncbi:MAG TPA: GNAT family N-acetyltransferase [Gaiellales bacterium]
MFAPAYPIETERLLLRPFAQGDYDALLAIQSRADVTRFLYWEPRTPDEVLPALERRIADAALWQEGDTLGCAVVLRTTGELIGDCSLHWVSAEHRVGEIGFVFHPDHHGRGYATEAARPLLEFGFATVGLHRIIGRLEARNVASARVLEKLGMRREALLIENEFVKGEWQSELDYAILDREWRALRATRAA